MAAMVKTIVSVWSPDSALEFSSLLGCPLGGAHQVMVPLVGPCHPVEDLYVLRFQLLGIWGVNQQVGPHLSLSVCVSMPFNYSE